MLGRGYAELKLTVTARKVGEALPPEPVRPVCPDDAHCVFGLKTPHTIPLTDDRFVRLVPRGDSVALVARALKLDEPAAVEGVFRRGPDEISRRKIAFLADYWTGKPM